MQGHRSIKGGFSREKVPQVRSSAQRQATDAHLDPLAPPVCCPESQDITFKAESTFRNGHDRDDRLSCGRIGDTDGADMFGERPLGWPNLVVEDLHRFPIFELVYGGHIPIPEFGLALMLGRGRPNGLTMDRDHTAGMFQNQMALVLQLNLQLTTGVAPPGFTPITNIEGGDMPPDSFHSLGRWHAIGATAGWRGAEQPQRYQDGYSCPMLHDRPPQCIRSLPRIPTCSQFTAKWKETITVHLLEKSDYALVTGSCSSTISGSSDRFTATGRGGKPAAV